MSNSYLNNQMKAFSSSVKGTSNRFVSSKRTVGSAPSTAPSTPGPSAGGGGGSGSDALKRKRPAATSANSAPKVYTAPATDSAGARDLMSQVHFAITYLKDKEVALTAEELAGKLSIQLTDTLRVVLRDNERIHYDAKSDTYAFKPIHNIRTPQALVQFLENSQQNSAQGLSVKELKDGWSGAIETISKLEADREILVTRTKKDNQPRMVWRNDKSLDVKVEDEFKNIWNRVQLPEPAELPRALTEAGLKPTSVDPASIKKAATNNAARKKPKRQRAGRITNTHMSHIIKDFGSNKTK